MVVCFKYVSLFIPNICVLSSITLITLARFCLLIFLNLLKDQLLPLLIRSSRLCLCLLLCSFVFGIISFPLLSLGSFFFNFWVWYLGHIQFLFILKYFFSSISHVDMTFFIIVQLSTFFSNFCAGLFFDQCVLQKSVLKFPNINGVLEVIVLLLISNKVLLWSENLILILCYLLRLALWPVRGQFSN